MSKDVFSISFFPDQAWLEAALAKVKEGKNVSIGVNIIDSGTNCQWNFKQSMDVPIERIVASCEYNPN